jgi:hypothetical protein
MNIKWSAVLVSWVVDIGGSTLFGIVLFSVLIASGLMPTALASDQRALTAFLVSRPDLYAISFGGGLFFSLLAGYVAARLAGRRFLLHGLLSSGACLASDLFSLDQLSQLPLWFALVGTALGPAAGVAGAYLHQLQTRRAERATV